MQVALPLTESNQPTLVPKQVIGLTALLLAGTAVVPSNPYALQEIASLRTKITAAPAKTVDEGPMRTDNIRIMEEKAGNSSFSCVNVSTLSLIEASKEKAEIQAGIVASVLTWEGTAYKWGGRSRSGVDCSALVQRVFLENGIQLPRTSYEQFREGVGIPKARLQPGDLIFFHTNGAGASHVGIYLGDNKFISAAKHCVQISSMDERYWAEHYRGSRRVIA
ncbi:MAG: NlpC/P60 family protein [Dehalobacter sp. 4CP]|uniref:C40 family peptidase n=1 Tax=Dehalobacter sp. CP TaxID=2594474 RepID=UPI0013CAA13E|nr:NlpC/P60 family protein [Dehalobacter sp.]NBJ15621.1 NlpC/P60 family protein [Dehalobacter sp. 4CP]